MSTPTDLVEQVQLDTTVILEDLTKKNDSGFNSKPNLDFSNDL